MSWLEKVLKPKKKKNETRGILIICEIVYIASLIGIGLCHSPTWGWEGSIIYSFLILANIFAFYHSNGTWRRKYKQVEYERRMLKKVKEI